MTFILVLAFEIIGGYAVLLVQGVSDNSLLNLWTPNLATGLFAHEASHVFTNLMNTSIAFSLLAQVGWIGVVASAVFLRPKASVTVPSRRPRVTPSTTQPRTISFDEVGFYCAHLRLCAYWALGAVLLTLSLFAIELLYVTRHGLSFLPDVYPLLWTLTQLIPAAALTLMALLSTRAWEWSLRHNDDANTCLEWPLLLCETLEASLLLPTSNAISKLDKTFNLCGSGRRDPVGAVFIEGVKLLCALAAFAVLLCLLLVLPLLCTLSLVPICAVFAAETALTFIGGGGLPRCLWSCATLPCRLVMRAFCCFRGGRRRSAATWRGGEGVRPLIYNNDHSSAADPVPVGTVIPPEAPGSSATTTAGVVAAACRAKKKGKAAKQPRHTGADGGGGGGGGSSSACNGGTAREATTTATTPNLYPSPMRPPDVAPAPGGGSRTAPRDSVSNMCVICMDKPQDHILNPCGHAVYCGECAQTCIANGCSMCRQPCTSVLKIYR